MKEKYPRQPSKCPACGDRVSNFGSTCDFIMYDDSLPCLWIILRGWTCRTKDDKKLIFGAVIRHGPIDDETSPIDMFEDDCIYDLSLSGRKLEYVS